MEMKKDIEYYNHLPCATCDSGKKAHEHEHTCIRIYACMLDKLLHEKVRLCDRIGYLMEVVRDCFDPGVCPICCIVICPEEGCGCGKVDDLGLYLKD